MCANVFVNIMGSKKRPIKRKSLLSYAGIWKLTVEEQKIMVNALKDLEGQFDDMFR